MYDGFTAMSGWIISIGAKISITQYKFNGAYDLRLIYGFLYKVFVVGYEIENGNLNFTDATTNNNKY